MNPKKLVDRLLEEEEPKPDQLTMGIEVEKEHTDDPKVAEKIARDHLAEDPDYYSKLKRCGIVGESDGGTVTMHAVDWNMNDRELSINRDLLIRLCNSFQGKALGRAIWDYAKIVDGSPNPNELAERSEVFFDWSNPDESADEILATLGPTLAPVSESVTCPICSRPAVGCCRCSNHVKHTLEDLSRGHGHRCANGHRWSSQTADGKVVTLAP